MLLHSLALLCLSSGGSQALPELPSGRFLEARTAAVFAGGCHYNAELVNRGESALLAFAFEGGSWQGVLLAGRVAVLVLDADRNLTLEGARRRSFLYLDPEAGPACEAALLDLFRSRWSSLLGELAGVRRVPLELRLEELAYALCLPGIAALEGVPLPDRACCSMPGSIWYRPFCEEDPATRTAGVRVGNSALQRYADPDRPASPRWSWLGQNDALLGSFRLQAAAPR
jgi:hypothetical protein